MNAIDLIAFVPSALTIAFGAVLLLREAGYAFDLRRRASSFHPGRRTGDRC